MDSPHETGAADPRRERLTALFEAHVDFVWRTLCRLGLPEDQADDAVQDVFLVVHRRLDDLRDDREARPWLYAISRRVASGHRRKAWRRREGSADLRLVPAADGDPEHATARGQAARLVDEFLDQLDELRRVPFVLYEIEGLTGREIAEATGWKLNTVFTRLKAARRRFESFVAGLPRGDEERPRASGESG